MSDQIDTRISASLHPGVVQALDGYHECSSFLGQVETAFSECYEGLRSVHNAREAAKLNPTWNDAQQVIHVDDLARRVFDRTARLMDTAKGNLDKSIASYEAQLSGPVEANASQAVAAEIRSHVKALPLGERLSFIERAVRQGDHLSASAVLGAPSYLSGLQSETSVAMTRLFHERSSPEVARRLNVMKAARSLLIEKGGLLHKEMERAVGMAPTKVAALRQAKTAAEQAFILKDA